MKRRTDLGNLLLTLAALALIPAAFFDVFQGIGIGRLADEIRITVDGDTDRVRFSARLRDGIDKGLEERQNGHSWIHHHLFATALFLHADAEALAAVRSVTVQIDKQKKTWSRQELLRDWKPAPTPPLYHSDRSEVLSLQYPDSPPIANQMLGFWQGWPAAMLWGARAPLICFALLLLLTEGTRRWARRSDSRNVIDGCLRTDETASRKAQSERSATRLWFASGLAFVALALTWLEWNQHLYFTQDDNFAQFLPVILQGCGAVFQGHLPLWNPYQLYGAPTLTLGTYALTYPGTYLSYAIAKFVFGDERLTIEVFAILHLLAGYAAMFWLLRQQRIRNVLACSGAICFVLSGFFLEAGRSWFYMLPVAFWVPLLLGTALKLLQGRFSWSLTIATGCIVGVFFHAGNAQMWIYALLFLTGLTVVLAASSTFPWKNAARLVPALLLGIAIAAPLLILQSAETADLERIGGQGRSLGEGGLAHVVLPLGPLFSNGIWGGIDARYSNEVYFCGTLFVLATALGLMSLLAFQRQRRGEKLLPVVANNVWLLLAFIAFIYALGPAGAVWTVTALLPVFNKLNGAMKFIAFFNLFAIIGGALVCQRLLKNRPRLMNQLALATLALTALHVLFARASFYSYADRHYVNPPEAVRAALSTPAPERFLAVAANRSIQDGFSSSLTLNFSTAAGLISAWGYDPLVEQTPANERMQTWLYSDPRAAAKAFGISWVLLHRTAIDPPDTTDVQFRPVLFGTEQQLYHVFLEQTDRVVRAGEFTLIHIPGSAPLAFSASAPDRSLPVQWSTEGAVVDTTGLPTGTQVTVNVLARPWLRFRQNGHELATVSDRLGRPAAALMFAGKPLVMRYSPPMRRPLTIALALLIASLVSAVLIQRFAETASIPFRLNRAPAAAPKASPCVSA